MLKNQVSVALAGIMLSLSLAYPSNAITGGATSTAAASPMDVLNAAGPYIDRANRDWTVAIRTHDADALSGPYVSDAVFVLPDGAAIKGRDAIHDLYAKRSATGVAVVAASAVSAGRTAVGDNDVYEWGSAWTTVRSSDRKVSRRRGRYLTVWHRYPDQHWKITRNLAF